MARFSLYEKLKSPALLFMRVINLNYLIDHTCIFCDNC